MLRRDNPNGLKARMVLDDALSAFEELRLSIDRRDRQLFRRRWVAAIALLRAVGHVLNGADKKLHPELGAVIADVMERTRDEDIFKHFIAKTRNLTIKEYRSGLQGAWNTSSPMALVEPDSDEASDLELVFIDGYYKGTPMVRVFTEALEWWEYWLDKVERHVQPKVQA